MTNTGISESQTKAVNKVSYAFSCNKIGDTSDKILVNRTENKQSKLIRNKSLDTVIVEEPLQITLSWLEHEKRINKVFTITMRTPGHDYFLIIGLLHSEGIIKELSHIESIKMAIKDTDGEGIDNEWIVTFTIGFIPDLSSLDRYTVSYSSCGLCGTTSLKSLQLKTEINLFFPEHKNIIEAESLLLLSNKMRDKQSLFDNTGGVHGVALFDQELNLQQVHEDIGRHNAVDKVIGSLLVSDKSLKVAPLWILLVSGRISFEIVQKAIMAGINVLMGVGAPSALAIQAAQQFDLTLIGFVSDKGFNVYHGDWRLANNVE
jgi:FdhD protein